MESQLLTETIARQINEAVKNYLHRCCGQCKSQSESFFCKLNIDLATKQYGMLRRHPECPLEDKKGATK